MFGERYCLASSQVYQAAFLKMPAQMKYGEDVVYEESAVKLFEECEKIISVKQLNSYQNKDNFAFAFISSEKQREFLVAEIARVKRVASDDRRNCETIYYKPIPQLSQCTPVTRKEINLTPLKDDELEKQTGIYIAPAGDNTPPTNGQPLLPVPLFASLVPQDIINHHNGFKMDVGAIVGRLYNEGDRMKAQRDATIEQQRVNESLAQATNIVNNTSPSLLSNAAIDGANHIRTKGGFDSLQTAYNQVVELRNADRQKLLQLAQVVQSGFNHPSLTSPYQTPQQKTIIQSLQTFQIEGTQYDDSISTAAKIDDSVFTKMREIRPVLDAITTTAFTPTDVNSTRGLIGAVIAASSATSLTASLQSLVPTTNLTQQISEKLPVLIAALATYQKAEDTYYQRLDELRGVDGSINIVSLLMNRGEKPVQKVLDDEKVKITSRVEPLGADNANCVKLLQEVDALHRQLKTLLEKTNQATAVDRVNSKLIATAESYIACEAQLAKGLGFYNMLKDRIFDYNTRISIMINSLPGSGGHPQGNPNQNQNPYGGGPGGNQNPYGGGQNPYGFGN